MIEVVLTEALTPDRNGNKRFFVAIKGVPWGMGGYLIVTRALLRDKAEVIQREIEDALDAYRKPKGRKRVRKPRTAWERLLSGACSVE